MRDLSSRGSSNAKDTGIRAMPNNEMPYVIAAYAAAWLVLVGYALYLRGVVQRAERLREESGRTAA